MKFKFSFGESPKSNDTGIEATPENIKANFDKFVRLESRNYEWNSQGEEVVWDDQLIDAAANAFTSKNVNLLDVYPEHLPHVMKQVAEMQSKIRNGEAVEISLE